MTQMQNINFNITSRLPACVQSFGNSLSFLGKRISAFVSSIFETIQRQLQSWRQYFCGAASSIQGEREAENIELERLAQDVPDDSSQNTYMTLELIKWTFNEKDPKGLVPFLNKVIDYFKSDSEKLKRALCRPNNAAVHSISKQLQAAGTPRNTPLMLLVKTGGHNDILQAIQLILPYYDREALLEATFRGNTVLHVALFTGQWEVVMAIMTRANELGILDELLAVKNNADKTANDILHFIGHDIQDPFSFILGKDQDSYLGGDELHLTKISNHGLKRWADIRYSLLNALSSYTKKKNPSTLQNNSLKDLWVQYNASRGSKIG